MERVVIDCLFCLKGIARVNLPKHNTDLNLLDYNSELQKQETEQALYQGRELLKCFKVFDSIRREVEKRSMGRPVGSWQKVTGVVCIHGGT